MRLRVKRAVLNNILQLELHVPDELVVQLSDTGMTPVTAFHVTLARLDDLGISCASVVLPSLPHHLTEIDIDPTLWKVVTEKKSSCYTALTSASAALVKEYIRLFERINDCAVLDPKRLFHVTLCNNADGDVRGSVGAVWEHTPAMVKTLVFDQYDMDACNQS